MRHLRLSSDGSRELVHRNHLSIPEKDSVVNFRKSFWIGLVMLLPVFLKVLPELGKIGDSVFAKVEFRYNSLFRPKWLKEIQKLKRRPPIDQAGMEDTWRQYIYPAIQKKWSLAPRSTNERYWRYIENRCIQATFRSSKSEEFAENVIGAGLHYTKLELIGEILFVAKSIDPKSARKDALCLLRSKLTDDMINTVASSWGEYARLKNGEDARIATCLKELRKSAPSIVDCNGKHSKCQFDPTFP